MSDSGIRPVHWALALAVLIPVAGISFWLGDEDHVLGAFFISRQGLWGDGMYSPKLTMLLVIMTVGGAAGVPLVFLGALKALWRESKPPLFEAPPSWDLVLVRRRMGLAAAAIVTAGGWLIFTGLAILAPEVLQPISFLATILLVAIPVAPVAVLVLLAEALVPNTYVEGTARVEVVESRNVTTTYVHVGELRCQVPRALQAGLPRGIPARALGSGFLRRLLRIEALRP